MKKAKRLTAILLSLVLCFALAACGGSETPSDSPPSNASNVPSGQTSAPTNTAPSGDPAPGDTATVGTAREDMIFVGDYVALPEGANVADSINMLVELSVVLLDPLSSASTFTACAVQFNMMFDRLVYRTPIGEYVGELATDWETSDNQSWTFKLRDDVTFHNGDKLTAQDVIDTWEIAMSDAAKGSNATDTWRDVASITAVDEYTVQIELRVPDSGFLYKLSTPFGAIVNKAAREADPEKGVWVGTGAFKVSEFVSGDHSVLTRNDDYWGTLPLTKNVTFRFLPEIAARTISLQTGESDVSQSISPSNMDDFVADPNFNVYAYAANSTHSLTFGMLNPITSDLNFRMAVAYALDREMVAQAAGGNWNKVNHDGAFWGDSTPYRNTDIPEITQDLEKAKEYLAASSYNGEEIDFLCGPDTLTLSAQMVAEQLSQIGINIKLRPTDVASLVGGSQYGNADLQLLHFVSPYTLNPTSGKNILYPNGSANRASYSNPEVSELLDLAPTLTDPNEIERVYKQIQELVHADMPQISLYERVWTVVSKNTVGGIVINADMYHDYRNMFMVVD